MLLGRGAPNMNIPDKKEELPKGIDKVISDVPVSTLQLFKIAC